MKTKILYHLIVTSHNGTQSEHFLKSNELHLLATILGENKKAEIQKHHVSDEFYNAQFGKN